MAHNGRPNADAAFGTRSRGSPTSLPPLPAVPASKKSYSTLITQELIETERKYVESLEMLQRFSKELVQKGILDENTIRLLFPNLNNLLNFQCKLLIRFEGTIKQPWSEQRWGQHFLECEEEFFAVYEPYFSNYTNATELLATLEQTLLAANSSISVTELRAFQVIPISRACKYPLCFNALIRVATEDESYGYLDELCKGFDAAHRNTEKLNGAIRRADNEQIVKNLTQRISDWQGPDFKTFGELLFEDILVVGKSEIGREHHVFFFEKVILFCREDMQRQPTAPAESKNGKMSSLFKQKVRPTPTSARSSAPRDSPLLLKGRIYINIVTQVVPVQPRGSTAVFPLQVRWKHNDDTEFFNLHFKREGQMKEWERTINRLVREANRTPTIPDQSTSPMVQVTNNAMSVRVGDAPAFL